MAKDFDPTTHTIIWSPLQELDSSEASQELLQKQFDQLLGYYKPALLRFCSGYLAHKNAYQRLSKNEVQWLVSSILFSFIFKTEFQGLDDCERRLKTGADGGRKT